MIVYRVEHAEEFQGPYRDYHEWDEYDGDAPSHRPMFEKPTGAPSEAPWGERYRFAFASEEKAWRWFDNPRERRKLSAAGFVLSVYHAADDAIVASRCRTQIVFEPARALLIERRSLEAA